ncbi:hypothetical protein EDC04DRAFT_2566240, partial [Pisolithus marmoratus]
FPTLEAACGIERVFGCRYAKSTLCRHRAIYQKADLAIREAFERIRSNEQGLREADGHT